MTLSLNLNRSGFWILKNHNNLIKFVNNLIIKENAKNYIIKVKSKESIIYLLNNKNLDQTCPIYKLNCWI